ncbi:class I SAM-dependent methyltransferase [Mariniblastus fucicola]|uniref:Leucine carboxyl methyltransferase n=1 Tax=Mariniblastus fucicola TaxID=980251 RepID=A0A5B9P4H5_9BACT|nr:class I SAM-dependent methyltransferase [Mariniblastus fucicola]QEG21268.1 Leucine carboxyl methyltransferase [Mariniblastus fucicola]
MNTTRIPERKIVSWEEDYRSRSNPELMNRLLYKAVPVLEATQWKITRVEPGYCETVLPLNHATTNQHGTHQAALISLSADYTGGMALTSLLRGVPLAGIHQCRAEESASLWLASMNVKYVKPSTGHMTGRCRVPDDLAKKIVDRYASGKRVLVSLPIEFETNGQKVAEAELKYFAQPTIQLMSGPAETSTLLNAKAKASARMIAGVRARSHGDRSGSFYKGPRIDCAHAATAAGPHGMLLAEKMNVALPQLADMVMARTMSIDQTTRAIPGLQQIVMLGAGLDMRPFRNGFRGHGFRYFEVDLPEMLGERERVCREIDGWEEVDRTPVAANFLTDDVAAKLSACENFDPNLATLFIFEGCSMYFDQLVNTSMVESVRSLMKHPESRLWVDFVNQSAIDGTADEPNVSAFLKRMSDLGETFTYGVSKPDQLLKHCGMKMKSATTTGEMFSHVDAAAKSVLGLYWFTVSSA